MSAPKHTPGPWSWFGNNHGIYLASTHSGRIFAMGFERFGMQGAMPSFPIGYGMKSAAELVRFQVGDGKAMGFAEGKRDATVYRYDITSIDHPNAHLIAAAPEMREALVAMLDIFSDQTDQGRYIRRVLAKADGESQ